MKIKIKQITMVIPAILCATVGLLTTYCADTDFDRKYDAPASFDPFNPAITYSVLNDTRGEIPRTYRTVVMPDGKTWMAENLNYYTQQGSWCYNNSPDSCAKYGRLYDWATAMGIDSSYNTAEWDGSDVNHQGICPDGWHLPSEAEWDTLLDPIPDASMTAGTKLKSSVGWEDSPDHDVSLGTNDYGFSALPGGFYHNNIGFDKVGLYGYWWNATADGNYLEMSYDLGFVNWWKYEKTYGFSVRCVKNDQ